MFRWIRTTSKRGSFTTRSRLFAAGAPLVMGVSGCPTPGCPPQPLHHVGAEEHVVHEQHVHAEMNDALQLAEYTEPATVNDNPATAIGPAVTGKRLGLLPGSTATERALKLMEENDKLEETRKELMKEIEKLKKDVQTRDETLRVVDIRIEQAQNEIELLTAALKSLNERYSELELQLTDDQDITALRNLLEQLIELQDKAIESTAPSKEDLLNEALDRVPKDEANNGSTNGVTP